MDLANLRDRVTRDVCKPVDGDLPAAAQAEISRIVGEALLEATRGVHARSKEAVAICCGPEADLAHKIQQRLDQQRDMLIANLMALR